MPGFDTGVPHIARVYDYWLGGEDNIGTGIPTANNTHEVARQAAPQARIAYVDNDPIVLSHRPAGGGVRARQLRGDLARGRRHRPCATMPA